MKHQRKIPTFYWEYPGHKPPPIDAENYTIKVTGCVRNPLELRLRDLPSTLPFVTVQKRFYCVNGWTIEDDWGGYLLGDVMELVGPEAEYLRTTSIGGYEDTTPHAHLVQGGAILATHMGGSPLLPKRGFPIRLVVFDLYQFKGVKSVATLEVTPEYRPGTWQKVGYRDATIQPYPHLDITSGAKIMPDRCLTPNVGAGQDGPRERGQGDSQ
jgi:DMSO/TMAO reductase YedYZ molybdopterin-dependent catalytic subunit